MSYSNPRIKDLNMSTMDVLVTMAEGNPGASRVLADLWQQNEAIDPDSALGSMGGIFALDNLDCYGSRIWMLYKDVCGQNLPAMVGVLRAVQLGLTSGVKLNEAIDGNHTAIDLPDLLAAVKDRLPNIGLAERAKPTP